MKHPVVLELFAEARNYNIATFITTQYLILLPTEIRSNVQLWFFFKDFGERGRKCIYTEAASAIRPFAKFEEVFTSCTSNRRVFVVDKAYTGDEPWGPFSYWRPQLLPDECQCNPKVELGRCPECGAYKIGSSEFWAYNKRHFDVEAKSVPQSVKRIKGKPPFTIILEKIEDE